MRVFNCGVRHRGFSLVEVMVAVGIVAILALLMVPSYQDKIVRDQIVEALPLANVAKTAVAGTWAAAVAANAGNALAVLPATAPSDTVVAGPPAAVAPPIAVAFPADNAAAGLPSADKIVNNFISAVTVADGAINITFGNRANGIIKAKLLTLRPAIVEDAPVVPVAWVCGYAKPPGGMTVKGENKTNIPANYLPFLCRAA